MPVTMIFDIARRFWWLVPMLVFAGAATLFHIERDHARAELVTVRDTLAMVKAVGEAQARKSLQIESDQEHQNATLSVKLDQTLRAHRLVSDALADRVREYAARGGACPVPGDPSSSHQPDSAPGEPGHSGAVAGTIGDLVAACQRDADRYNALREWAASLSR